MNYIIDIFILLCLGWGAFKGFKKGFILQSFSIIALLLGIWSGFTLSGMVTPFLSKYMSALACSIVAFIIVFLSVLALVYLSGHILSKLVSIIALGLINRLAGATFGILTNALVLSVVITFFNKINDIKHFVPEEQLENTCLYRPIGKTASVIFPDNFLWQAKDALLPI